MPVVKQFSEVHVTTPSGSTQSGIQICQSVLHASVMSRRGKLQLSSWSSSLLGKLARQTSPTVVTFWHTLLIHLESAFQLLLMSRVPSNIKSTNSVPNLPRSSLLLVAIFQRSCTLHSEDSLCCTTATPAFCSSGTLSMGVSGKTRLTLSRMRNGVPLVLLLQLQEDKVRAGQL